MTYPRKVPGLHEHLHEVWDASGRVADDEHDGDGDGGAGDAALAFPQGAAPCPPDLTLVQFPGSSV